MPGLLNANKMAAPAMPADNQSAEADQQLDSPILKQIEAGIEAKVPPELRKAYLQAVVAGMELMFNEKTSKFIDERLQESDDIVGNVSKGIADLMILLYNESKQTMEIPAAMLAALTLMCQALDYAEQKFGTKITSEIAAACAKATTLATMQKFGITPDKLQQAAVERDQGQSPTGEEQQPEMGGM